MPKRVVGGYAGAPHRRGLDRGERVGDACQGGGRDDDGLGVPARIRPARHLNPFAVDEVALAAGQANATVATEPANGHPVAGSPAIDVVSDHVNAAGDLVAGDQRERHVGEGGVDERRVGAAYTAGFDGDADLAPLWLGQLPLDDREGAAGLVDLSGSDGGHGVPRCWLAVARRGAEWL